jgi:hypothetical protein
MQLYRDSQFHTALNFTISSFVLRFFEEDGFCEAEEVFDGADICEARISYQLPEGNVLRSSLCFHIAYKGG